MPAEKLQRLAPTVTDVERLRAMAVSLPLLLATIGLGVSIVGIFITRSLKNMPPARVLRIALIVPPFLVTGVAAGMLPAEGYSTGAVLTLGAGALGGAIVGLITENIYYGGKLVIPAGTEIHGTAQTDHQRERIASGNSWTLIWQNGMEMQIKAIALDREFANNTNQTGWAITDGSAGLRGEVIKSDNLADIKLFAATFLSGAAGALTEKQQTVFGPINSPTLNNAPFAGAQAVLQTYAQQIFDSIQKNGFYVRVPSGKQFYLYVLQTIDAADASLGGIAIPVAEENDSQPTTKSKR
jgi:hypothetical protein